MLLLTSKFNDYSSVEVTTGYIRNVCLAATRHDVVQMAKTNGVRWYRHVLRRDDGHVLRKAMEFEEKGKRKRGRPKEVWKMQVEKERKSVGLEEDAMNRAKWGVGVGEIAVRVE